MFRALLLSALAAIVVAAGVGMAASPQAAAAPAQPDLRIRDWWVVPDAAVAGNQVKYHKPYRVCYRVVNTGIAPSGAFHVGGGGLGIPFNPTMWHPGLAPNGMAVGCLFYPTTPAPGGYALGIKADHFNVVPESNEANNELVEPIAVLP
jgi:subtilase family serine protease